jgi:hypothetical protein
VEAKKKKKRKKRKEAEREKQKNERRSGSGRKPRKPTRACDARSQARGLRGPGG